MTLASGMKYTPECNNGVEVEVVEKLEEILGVNIGNN